MAAILAVIYERRSVAPSPLRGATEKASLGAPVLAWYLLALNVENPAVLLLVKIVVGSVFFAFFDFFFSFLLQNMAGRGSVFLVISRRIVLAVVMLSVVCVFCHIIIIG